MSGTEPEGQAAGEHEARNFKNEDDELGATGQSTSWVSGALS